MTNVHIAGLVQDRRNSIADTLELHLSCTTHRYSWNMQYILNAMNTVMHEIHSVISHMDEHRNYYTGKNEVITCVIFFIVATEKILIETGIYE